MHMVNLTVVCCASVVKKVDRVLLDVFKSHTEEGKLLSRYSQSRMCGEKVRWMKVVRTADGESRSMIAWRMNADVLEKFIPMRLTQCERRHRPEEPMMVVLLDPAQSAKIRAQVHMIISDSNPTRNGGTVSKAVTRLTQDICCVTRNFKNGPCSTARLDNGRPMRTTL